MRALEVAGGRKMGKIFINYRREDAPDAAARIHREPSSAFGAKNLFMDVDNLLAGQRFDRELERRSPSATYSSLSSARAG